VDFQIKFLVTKFSYLSPNFRVKEAPLVVHYDPFEEKGRVFGASHVPLPTLNEEARETKIAELKSMTEETKLERTKRKLQRNAEKEEERYRVNKIRQRYFKVLCFHNT